MGLEGRVWKMEERAEGRDGKGGKVWSWEGEQKKVPLWEWKRGEEGKGGLAEKRPGRGNGVRTMRQIWKSGNMWQREVHSRSPWSMGV